MLMRDGDQDESSEERKGTSLDDMDQGKDTEDT
jgi:hypothetical protein